MREKRERKPKKNPDEEFLSYAEPTKRKIKKRNEKDKKDRK